MAFEVVASIFGVKSDRQRIQKLVEQYKEFREIFKSNQEVIQDFEVLESIAFDNYLAFADSPSSWSLSNLMLICQRDGIIITVVSIFRGVINLRTYWKQETNFRIISNLTSTLIKFTLFVKDFVTKSFPEIEDVTDGIEQLITEADDYVKKVCKILIIIIHKIVFTTDAIEKDFPSDEEHKSRLDFGIRGLANLDEENAAVLSEQAIICALRCSFTLILSYSMLSSSDKKYEESILTSKAEDLQNCLLNRLSQCEKASETFNTKFQELLQVRTESKIVTTVKGISIPRELRFSSEVKLYENTVDMINRVSEMMSILQNIRSDSINIITEKSNKNQNDDDNQNSSLSTNILHLQDSGNDLDKKLQCFNTFMKLQSQIIAKICSEKSLDLKKPIAPPIKCPSEHQDDESVDETLNENSSDQVGECIYYGGAHNEAADKGHQREGIYDEGVDELFELITYNEVDNERPIDNDQVGDPEVEEARQVVLEQLKTVLKPRHDIMKTREEEAYKRAYGERPVQEEPEEEEVTVKKVKKLCVEKDLKWDEINSESDEDEIEDQFIENENSMFSSDFKNRIDSILKKGAGSSY